MRIILFLLCVLLLAGCMQMKDEQKIVYPEITETATLAGGCFWCMEAPFEKLEGVVEVISGYSGGEKENPTYKEVSSGTTGHLEAVQIIYDPTKITYKEILDKFWRQVNPTDDGGQFVDRGSQYATAIFYHNEEQKRIAEESKIQWDERGIFESPIVTPIIPFEVFYKAEEYHQDYYKKNPLRYKYYRSGSGRDDYLQTVEEKVIEMSDKPTDEQLKEVLTPLQYKVTQQDGTEPAFDNEYWDNKEEGIYVDIVSGEPLFSSKDKYVSGTGWPSFTQPLEPNNIVEKQDKTLFTTRTEIRSKGADSHLGHVFNDGPEPTGLRYCMNSAALRFIPKENLQKEGYGQYLNLFEE